MPLRAFSVFVGQPQQRGSKALIAIVLMPLRAFSVFVAICSTCMRNIGPACLNALTGIQCIRRITLNPAAASRRTTS